MLLAGLIFACSDPVQEYSIPKKTDDNWEDWAQKSPAQQGAPVGEAIGKPPEDGLPANDPNGAPVAQIEPPGEGVPQNPDEEFNAPPLVPEGRAENAAHLDSGECRPVASSEAFAPSEADGLKLTGTIKKPDGIVGSILLEFAKSSDGQSQTHYGVVCGFTESFTVDVPTGLSDVYVVAFVDVNGDGPSEEDPRGMIGPISPSQSGELDDITVDNNAKIAPLALPFMPFVNNMPVINEGENGTEQPINTDDLPPPTTEVGFGREELDVPAVEGEDDADLPPPVAEPSDDIIDEIPPIEGTPEAVQPPQGDAP